MNADELDCMYEWMKEEEFKRRCPLLSQVYWDGPKEEDQGPDPFKSEEVSDV